MSKLKEIIHQYVVEALEEILSEEADQINELSLNTLKSYRDKVYDKYTPDGYGTPTSERPKPKFTRSQGYGRAETNIENKTPLEYEPKVHDLTHFEDDGDVYDHTQTSDEIRDGDVMKLSGGRVATMYRAFPVMHKGESNVLHRTHEGKTIGDIGTRYKETEKLANKVANMKEEGVRRERRIGTALANAALKGGNDPTNIRRRRALTAALNTAVDKNVRSKVKRTGLDVRKRLTRTPESDPHDQNF